jgi:hypothetical protein
MMARAFEAVIESCSEIENSHLVSGTEKQDRIAIYPDMLHRQTISDAMLAYFKPLRGALSR